MGNSNPDSAAGGEGNGRSFIMFQEGRRIPDVTVSAIVVCAPRQSQLVPHTERLVSSKVVRFPLKVMLWINIDKIEIGREVWDMERRIGSMGLTPITHALSFQIMETNSKSGNVGWNLILLNLRTDWSYPSSDISYPFYCREGKSHPWRRPLSDSSIFV